MSPAARQASQRVTGRVLVTGAAGMLGSQLMIDAPDGVEALGTDVVERPEEGDAGVAFPGVDLAEPDQVEALLEQAGSLAGCIHAAAYTAVDRAEEEPELARRVNALAPEVLGRSLARRGVPMVFVSTDFVFDGRGDRTEPYRPDEPTDPLGVYGRTKWEGEERARAAHHEGLATVRTQWLYGPRGHHFPGTILRLAAERDELKVVDDQVGSPTSTLELSPALWDTLQLRGRGTYHAACEGRASWFELARETLRLCGRDTRVVPCTSAEFPRPAPRPAFSVLDSSSLARLRGRPLKPWAEALADFLRAEGLLG